MKKYSIGIHGCDDSTYIEMELSNEQLEFVKSLCEKSKENSSYGCMPIMEIEEV